MANLIYGECTKTLINKFTELWAPRVLVVLVFSCCYVSNVFGKRFETRCKLARELLKVGVKKDLFLGQWVCLIEKSSNRDTSAYTVSPSGKKFYGLYQIPSQWCKVGKRGGDCDVKCEDLLNDDIRDDTACAMKIFYREGFKYWPAWVTRCKNDNFITNEIYKCPDLRLDRSSQVEEPHLTRIHKRSAKPKQRSSLKRKIFK